MDMEDLPGFLKSLYPIADVKNSNDAFVFILHTFMLEVGFIPEDIPENEKLKMLPKSWHDNGVYRIVYYHSTCPELNCMMTCVPLNQLLSVFGTVDAASLLQKTNFCLKVNHYVNHNTGFSDPSKVFFNVRELSQKFKNEFAYTLLAAMQNALGFGPTFGLSVTMDHIKMQILSYLPVESLVAMSCVNKEFSELCDMPSLWKNLYLKDFSVALVDSAEVKQGWKQLYKEKYLLRKRQHDMQNFMLPSPIYPRIDFHRPVTGWHPPINPYPRIGPDLQIGIPEEVRNAFPHLQQRTWPNNVIHQPGIPRNPSLNFPGIFRFF